MAKIEFSNRTNLIEQAVYKFNLQDIPEPNLYREIMPYKEIPKVTFNHRLVPMFVPEEIWITDTTFRDGQQSRSLYLARKLYLSKYGTPLPIYVIDSIKKNKVALKGPITTSIGIGFRSVNVELRQTLDLYANVRPIKSYKGVPSRYSDIDLVIVRENTEDLYAGIEHKIGEYAVESIKIITRKASERIARFAFRLAKRKERKLP